MIDRESRDKLALLMRRVVLGRISEEEFWRTVPSSDTDGAIQGILQGIDDVSPELTIPESRKYFAQYMMFLYTNTEYVYPKNPTLYPDTSTFTIYSFFITVLGLALGYAARYFPDLKPIANALWAIGVAVFIPSCLYAECRHMLDNSRFRSAGDMSAWPFLRPADYQEALQSPRFLNPHQRIVSLAE